MPSPEAEADYLVDRRKLRRSLSFWRVLAFLAAGLAIVVLGLKLSGGLKAGLGSEHIARVAIKGLIVGDDETLKLIREAGESKSASAIILAIDSPGGTTTGSDLVYQEIRRAAAKKPVVAPAAALEAPGWR